MSAPRPREPRAVQLVLIGLALAAIGLFLLVPLAAVFVEAFRHGAGAWLAAVSDPDARHAVKLTLIVAAIAVPVNAVFGLAAGWALGKFRFPGRSLVLTLVDLPFAVSPIVAGLVFVLAFGRSSLLGGWLAAHGVEVVFAVPGIVLATVFVTFPFVARELVPLMQSQGTDEEEAARVLGAGFFTTFLRVTLPNVKWALLYGIVLCTARAVGEFGAVSVVSGHVRGATNTLPLHVETLYNEYAFQGAFAAASLLTLVALAAMLAKAFLSRHAGEEAP
ncbi:MAG: sulfate ABC transporter permease subunit CysW [Holophagales bacterium]|nr:sulfate ABC transporter permease subunit CysW [Holophagales bacterium]